MKEKNNFLFLGLTVVCGGAAGVLRYFLLETGLDEKGLLIPGNPLNYGLWALSIGYLLVLLLLLRRMGGDSVYRDCFPECKVRGFFSMTGGALLVVESVRLLLAAQTLPGGLGLLAGIAMFAAGLCRWVGKQPTPLFHCVVCVFFIVRLILSFQGWSADPQFQDYAMQLMASVSLMLFAFHRASCDANLIQRKRTAFYGLAAVYFCLGSLSDSAMPLLYIAGGLWAVGAGGDLDYLPEEA